MRRYSSSRHISLLMAVYLIVGVVVASNRNYLVDLGSVDNALSAVLAVLLWPVLLFGADLHLSF